MQNLGIIVTMWVFPLSLFTVCFSHNLNRQGTMSSFLSFHDTKSYSVITISIVCPDNIVFSGKTHSTWKNTL